MPASAAATDAVTEPLGSVRRPRSHVSVLFEQLASSETHEGVLSLRRRHDPTRGVDVHEVKLDDEFLMSSMFTVAEVELARLGLAAATGAGLDVVVGGLGLGYTARAALEDDRVATLTVVEALRPVIDWHLDGLLPVAASLTGDARCRLNHADFFEVMGASADGGHGQPSPLADVVLLDIDHTPRHVLHPSHAGFYTAAGLRSLAERLRPAGVFALWSDDPPDDEFGAVLDEVFGDHDAHVVAFPNHLTGGESANTVYVAVRRDGG